MTKARFRPFTLNECGDVLDVNEMAKLFHVSTDAITKRCRNGQIPGAFKQGKYWYCSKENIRQVAGI